MRGGWMGLGMMSLSVATSVAGQDLPRPRDMDLPASRFEMPDTNQFRMRLPNDMMIWAVPDYAAPVVRYTAFVRAGFGDDREGGVAEFLTWVMRTRGPCWLGGETLDQALDELTARLNVTLGPEMTEITLTAPAAEGEQALRLFAGVVRQACVDEDALAAFRALHAGADGSAYSGSLEGAYRLFRDSVFADHRYQPGVRPEEAATLELDKVDDFYRDNFTPSNTTLAVSGAFRPEEIQRQLDFRFADWAPRRLPGFARTGMPDRPDTIRTYIHDVDQLQTWIVIGTPISPLEPRDLVPFEVMNYILGGGHFDTRLFRETRDKRGLTNDASGFLEPGLRGPGTYTVRTYGRPSVADSLMDIVFRELQRIQQEEVTEEELFVARGALIDGKFAMQFENGHAVARTFALEWARYLTLNHLAAYPERVRDVDAGDVRRAARRIRVDRLVRAVVRSR